MDVRQSPFRATDGAREGGSVRLDSIKCDCLERLNPVTQAKGSFLCQIPSLADTSNPHPSCLPLKNPNKILHNLFMLETFSFTR